MSEEIKKQLRAFVQYVRSGWATELAFDVCYDAVYDQICAEEFLNLCQSEAKKQIEKVETVEG